MATAIPHEIPDDETTMAVEKQEEVSSLSLSTGFKPLPQIPVNQELEDEDNQMSIENMYEDPCSLVSKLYLSAWLYQFCWMNNFIQHHVM